MTGETIVLTVLAVSTLANSILAAIRGNKAAKAATEVKQTLATSNSVQLSKLNAIHKLVNSEYGIALRTAAAALERIAVITKEPGDIEQAKAARQLSDDHDLKQRNVDASMLRERE